MLTPRAECSPSGRWPGYHSSCEALLIFHTDSLSWNCSYVSNISPEQAHCDVYEPGLFRKHLCASAINVTHAHIAHTAMNAYTAINVNTSSISYTADIPSRLLINFFTIVSTANTELDW